MRMPHKAACAALTALGVTLTLGLTGCFGSPLDALTSNKSDDSPSHGPTETDAPADPDVDGGDSVRDDADSSDSASDRAKDLIDGMLDRITGDDGDGSFQVGGDLPSGFPASVPVPALDIVMSSKIPIEDDQTSWQVTFSSTDIARDYDDEVSALEDAGFTKGYTGSFASLDTTTYTDADYGVTLSAVKGSEGDKGTLVVVVLPVDQVD